MRNQTLRDPAFLGATLQYLVGIPTVNFQFAANRSLLESVSGSNSLITTSRASIGTFFDASAVLQTAAINVPRFNTAQITLESLGLLLEGEQTNSIRNSTMQGAIAGTPGTAATNWSMTGSVNGLTRTLSLGTANGIAYIDARYVGTTTAAGTISISPDTITGIVASSGQSWAGLWFIAISGGSLTNITNPQVSVVGRDTGGVLLENFPTTISPTSQFVRYQRLASFVNANTARVQLLHTLAYANGVPIDVTIRLGLPQLERNVPTTPIGTSSGSVIRSADFADSTSPALLTAGTIFVEFRSPAVGICGVISLNDGTSGNRIDIRTSGTTAQVLVVTGGITQTTLSVGAVTANTRARLAVCLASSRVAASLNGGAAVSATATRPSVDRVAIGRTQAGEHLNGTLAALSAWAVAFTDSMLSAQST